MSLISRITPTNVTAQKLAFLENPNFNPLLTYDEPLGSEELVQFGKPENKYLELAIAILEKAYWHRNEADLNALEGTLCTQSQVEASIFAFLKLHQLENRFKVSFSHSYLSRASISATLLKIRLPLDFRKDGLFSALYHEIGTHALRRLNYEEQPWFKKKSKYGFQSYLVTEEGLASLHGLLPQSFQVAHVAALRYLVVSWAQSYSFLEVWHKLGRYIQDPGRRWVIAIRQKRGLEDTSQPGGFTKDAVYFQGMVEVWRWLSQHEFNPSDLYWGKLHHEDVKLAKSLKPDFQPKLPSFFASNPKKYQKQLKEIGELNYFTQI